MTGGLDDDGMLSFEPGMDRNGAFQRNKAQTPLQLGEIRVAQQCSKIVLKSVI